uniref:Uncharacterized protein n=2 Tax=viral metagenome TaxID=1070528 RepID=A0A6M3X8A2_9ZZZZ
MTTRAAQIECLMAPVHDYRTNAIASGYTVYFYAAGTSTAKNVWTEKEKTNPYTSRTLGSDGTIQVYGDGVYKIVIKDGDGTAVYTWDNVKVQSPNIAVLEKSGTYTATIDDDYILVNTAGGNVTINLYAAASFTHPICIKNIGTNNVVIDPNGAELIEGASTYTIGTQDAAVWLFSNGSAWYVANDVSISATDAVNLVAAFAGAKKLTAKATTIDIETNNEYLRQKNAAGTGYINILMVGAGDIVEVPTVFRFLNSGIHILDTNASHDLVLKAGSDLTADRILTITTGDAARAITLTGNLTANQDVSTAGTPTFVGALLSGLTASQMVFTDASKNLVSGLISGDVAVTGAGVSSIGSAKVTQSMLKTSTGSVSQTTTNANKALPGGEYGFYPQIKSTDGSGVGAYLGSGFTTTSYTTNIYLLPGGTDTAYAQQRYVTASGEVHWIFILIDKATGKRISTWQAPDHPVFGNSGIVQPHFDYNKLKHEIIVVNPPLEIVEEIEKSRRNPDPLEADREWIEVFDELYEIQESKQADWPDIEVTVGLPKIHDGKIVDDWRFMPQGTKIDPIKRVIPKPDYIVPLAIRTKL